METSKLIYAGFWKRLVAYFIDQIILSFINFIVIIPAIIFLGVSFFSSEYLEFEGSYSNVAERYEDWDHLMSVADATLIIFTLLFVFLIVAIIQWLYFSLMESSAKQATPGKRIMNLVVTDINGERISFARATGRYFGKIISGIVLYIGFIMAAFTERKQALHDILAGCLVLDRSPEKIYGRINNQMDF